MSSDDALFPAVDKKVEWSFVVIFAFLLSAIILSLLLAVGAFLANNYQRATNLADFASGVATIILVAVTFWYAYETRRLVRQTEQAREDERKREEKQKQRELNNLRRALINEIGAMEGLDELAEDYEPGYSLYRQVAPSTVYNNSAGQIGSLADEEVEAVVEYYTLGGIVDDHLAGQRKLDTEIGMTQFEQAWYYLSFQWLFDRSERKSRTEATAKRISELADAQEKALQLLKQNLQEQGE